MYIVSLFDLSLVVHIVRAELIDAGTYRLCFDAPVDKVYGVYDVHAELPVIHVAWQYWQV